VGGVSAGLNGNWDREGAKDAKAREGKREVVHHPFDTLLQSLHVKIQQQSHPMTTEAQIGQ
jgi:hypothetical protein